MRTVSFAARGEHGVYIEDLPSGYDGSHPLAVVFDLHGYLSTAAIERSISGLGHFGDTHGFITITPQVDDIVQHWNVSLGGADLAYLGDLLTHVERSACVDQRRVYFAGLSNGAWMTSAVACAFSARVAAVAAVAGIQDYPGCRASRPVPVVTFHGTADAYVSYEGGWGPAGLTLPALDGSTRTVGQELSIHPTPTALGPLSEPIPRQVAGWAHRNGCGPEPGVRRLAADVEQIAYPCPAGANVDFYRVSGGGHTWPGSKTNAAIGGLTGHTTLSIDAKQIIWQFFRSHPLSGS